MGQGSQNPSTSEKGFEICSDPLWKIGNNLVGKSLFIAHPLQELQPERFYGVTSERLFEKRNLMHHSSFLNQSIFRLDYKATYTILVYGSTSIISDSVMEKSIHSSQQDILQKLLKQLREEAGLRQVDLARLLGEPQPFVSKYERGERRLDILELRAICKILNLTLENFARRLEKALDEAR